MRVNYVDFLGQENAINGFARRDAWLERYKRLIMKMF